ncbi:hypothetical protein A3Q56_03269 [Intoshia linei]|uniref:Uncharacterized protein n=1 Tax=Intoshia linei TaxID=1819745 RepID=A0A177B3W7_9BILA|nr:hypothetical protein A3Q56_03269 [Intoshia linei]
MNNDYLVGGYGSGNLHYNCHSKFCSSGRLWPILETDKIDTMAFYFFGYYEQYLKLYYNEDNIFGRNYYNVDIKLVDYPKFSVDIIEYVTKSEKFYPLFYSIIRNFKKYGLIDLENMFGLVYDSRYRPGIYIEKNLRNVLEKSKSLKNRRTSIITYSFGCIQILHALATYDESFIMEHIDNLILISCPLGGSPASLLTLMTDYDDYIVFKDDKMYKMSDIGIFLPEQYPRYIYNSIDIENIFNLLDRIKYTKLVKLHCLYSTMLVNKTVKFFNVDFNDDDVLKYATKTLGDGTIPLNSLNACDDFVSDYENILYIKGLNHTSILHDDRIINYINKYVIYYHILPN